MKSSKKPSLSISTSCSILVVLLLGSSIAVPIQIHYRNYGNYQQPEAQQQPQPYFHQLQPQHRQQQPSYRYNQPSQWYGGNGPSGVGGISSPTAPPTAHNNNGNAYRSPLEPTGGDATGGDGGGANMAPMMMGSIRRAYHTYEDYMRSAAESFRNMVYKSWKMLGRR